MNISLETKSFLGKHPGWPYKEYTLAPGNEDFQDNLPIDKPNVQITMKSAKAMMPLQDKSHFKGSCQISDQRFLHIHL